MSTPTTITARESLGSPPQGLEGLSRIRWSVKNPPTDPDITFEGKTVLVTGANAGLGLEAAVKYAQRGASKLILAVRSAAKGEEAKQTIVQRSGRDSSFIAVLTVDLSTFESVRGFVATLERETSQLHVALLNAGLVNPSFVKASSGYEMALQVNVLSSALMAILLLPLLRRTAAATGEAPHLTFVNSHGHNRVKNEWYSNFGSVLEAANDASNYNAERSYCMAKLLGLAVMKHVAKSTTKVDGTAEIIVNACCPDLCRTNLGRSFPLLLRWINNGAQRFTARSAEEGSRTLVSATALGPESQGRFWHHDVLYPMGDIAQDDVEMEKMWNEINAVLHSADPGLETILAGRTWTSQIAKHEELTSTLVHAIMRRERG